MKYKNFCSLKKYANLTPSYLSFFSVKHPVTNKKCLIWFIKLYLTKEYQLVSIILENKSCMEHLIVKISLITLVLWTSAFVRTTPCKAFPFQHVKPLPSDGDVLMNGHENNHRFIKRYCNLSSREVQKCFF